MNDLRYQVVILNSGSSHEAAELTQTLRDKVAALGMSPSRDVRFIDDDSFFSGGQPTPSERAPLVCAYFGGPRQDPRALEALAALPRGTFILPIVPTLRDFTAQVPQSLHPINGMALAQDTPQLERAAGRLLEELRLSRRQRYAFISYRRSESAGVAAQLYDALHKRSFTVFLDTVSVELGQPFQEALWDKMADADLLIFLNTATAIESRWVAEEFANAQLMGLGVLHVVWPDVEPSQAAAFSTKVFFSQVDFVGRTDPHSPRARIKRSALQRIVLDAERLRSQAVAFRRKRLIDALCLKVPADISVTLHRTQQLELLRSGHIVGYVTPALGHPDSTLLQEAVRADQRPSCVMYDPFGLREQRLQHLAWLNGHLPVQAIAVEKIAQWIQSP